MCLRQTQKACSVIRPRHRTCQHKTLHSQQEYGSKVIKKSHAIPFPASPSGILSRALKLKRRKQRHQAAELPRAYEDWREQNSETVSQHSSSYPNFYAYRVQRTCPKPGLSLPFDKSQIGLSVPCPLCCIKVMLARPLKHTLGWLWKCECENELIESDLVLSRTAVHFTLWPEDGEWVLLSIWECGKRI